jgi:DedD protein
MAFFKFRTGAPESPETQDSDSATQTVDHLRRQARQRLIGAAVLVVLAVTGFPLVFDTQPRPVSDDMSIDIPSKAKQDPVQPPAPLAAHSGAVPAGAEGSGNVGEPKQSLSDKEELVAEVEKANPTPVVSTAAASKSDKSKAPAAKTETAKIEANKADAAKALAALTDTAKPKSGSDDAGKSDGSEKHYLVQTGSFLEEAKVRETRNKLEKAGLKTFTQVVEAKDGKRTRVRLGPFATKAEAEQAAEKAKSLQLQAFVLSY